MMRSSEGRISTIDITASDVEKRVGQLAAKHPQMIVSSIGQSLVGRNIPLIIMGNGKKSVLYVGAHHGMEGITADILLRFAERYMNAVERGLHLRGISAETLFANRRICLVPMLNPDGVELRVRGYDADNPLDERLLQMSGGDYSHWQANGRGVDLNHNYDAGFSEYRRLAPSLGIDGAGPTRYPGEYPESEPETAALCRYIRMDTPHLLIALHTQGEEIYYDYNGHVPKGADVMARRMARLSGYRASQPQGAACYSGLKDWFISCYDRPGFTVECGRGTNPLPPGDAVFIYGAVEPILISAPGWI